MPMLLGGDPQAESRVTLGAAGLAAAPAEGAGVATETPRGLDRRRAHTGHTFGIGRDVEGVGRAVDLAQETGLAVGLPDDGRRRGGDRIEDVGGADLDAHVAGDAATRRDDLDHDTASVARPSARAIRTSSKPLAWSEQANFGSAPGRSGRRCMPRLSARASAVR